MTVLEKDQSNPALYESKQLLVILLCCIYLCISLETPVLIIFLTHLWSKINKQEAGLQLECLGVHFQKIGLWRVTSIPDSQVNNRKNLAFISS